jgi:hypothetical protein
MASVQTSSYDGRYLKLTVVEESYSIANNTSTLRWTLESIGGNVNYYTIYNWGVWVNGQQIYGTQTTSWSSYNFPAKTGSATGTITVSHNADGSASDVSFQLNGCVYYNKSNSYIGSVSLTKIPRQATLTSAPDFNDEQNPTINYSNPAGSSVSSLMACISLTGSTDDIAYRSISVSGTSYTFNLTDAERNVLRNACTNANSRTIIFFVKTVIGSSTFYSTLTKTLSIINGSPTFTANNISYKDNNSKIVAITGNNQQIVRNLSSLVTTITSATAKKGASISKYEMTFNGSTKTISVGSTTIGTVNLSSNATLSIKVTDSRGNTTTASITIAILNWELPTATIEAKRVNNYEDETNLKISVSISSVNSKNSIQSINYRYKKSTDSNYSEYVSIKNNTTYQIVIDKLFIWDFQVEIKDKFGTKTYNFQVAKGMPILMIDVDLISIGINCFPTKENSLEVNGYDFDNLHPINSIITTTNNTNPSSSVTGTWELLTSTTINNITIYYWKRTA